MEKSFAIVTGASKGIGKAIAEKLAERKQSLILIARNETLLNANASSIREKYGIEVLVYATDLTKENALDKLMVWIEDKKLRINILVNNAGYGLSGKFDTYTSSDYTDMMQLNMNVPVLLCRKLLPTLQKEKASFILNIASSAAYQAVPGLSVYAATKSFVVSFSRGLQYELRNTNVSVSVVCPGPTKTEFVERANLGEKGKKAAEKLDMSPESVADIAVKAMFAKKTETIAGFINKLGAFLAWALPKKLSEKVAASIYEI